MPLGDPGHEGTALVVETVGGGAPRAGSVGGNLLRTSEPQRRQELAQRDLDAYTQRNNMQTLLIPIIEHPLVVENIDALCAHEACI